VFTLEGLAGLAVAQHQYEKAVQLFAWADAMREKIGAHPSPMEQASVDGDLQVIHSHLNDSDFAMLWAVGWSMNMEQAIELALEE
jgi:hypothetical protein